MKRIGLDLTRRERAACDEMKRALGLGSDADLLRAALYRLGAHVEPDIDINLFPIRRPPRQAWRTGDPRRKPMTVSEYFHAHVGRYYPDPNLNGRAIIDGSVRAPVTWICEFGEGYAFCGANWHGIRVLDGREDVQSVMNLPTPWSLVI